MDRELLSRIGFHGAIHEGPPISLGLPEESSTSDLPMRACKKESKDISEKNSKAAPRDAKVSAATAVPATCSKAQPEQTAASAERSAKSTVSAADGPSSTAKNFLHEIIAKDLGPGGRCNARLGKTGDVIRTRFPPEPNGYLHLGHCKSICLNFGLAETFGGRCHLRFDDTNPTAEKDEYVESIQEDVKWLGFSWGENLFFASSYFDQLYEWAEYLVTKGLAYVDSQSHADMKKNRGSLFVPGVDSPYRSRTPEENLSLFREMRDGKHDEGSHILRAKVDMKHANMNMRDPPIYRIRKQSHHRTGDKWCVYPLYDFAHGQEDAIEGITHSICTLEFEAHRELYDWFTANLPLKTKPLQFEFARLNLTNTVMSKRKLLTLVEEKIVDGWDDPRMPTICGMRRRGVTPEALRTFCARIGVTTKYSWTDVNFLEEVIREDLEPQCARRMAVLNPLKVVIEDYPKDKVEETEAANHPSKSEMGSRKLKFCREIYIERDDFSENPPEGYFRLKPDGEVKLRHSYVIKLKEIKKNSAGEIDELICTHDPSTRDTLPTDRKVKGVIHWVSARHSLKPAAVRLYNYLLKVGAADATEESAAAVAEEEVDEEAEEVSDSDAKKKAFLKELNPESLIELQHAKLEESLKDAKPFERFQFERNAFFVVDKYSKSGSPPIFNRIVGLKESSFKPDKDDSAASRSRKEEQKRQAQEKDAKKSIYPKTMFLGQTDLYSEFDADGLPTKDASGEALPNKRIKKLRAEWEKQKKLFDSAGK